ncbi:MAG TPA: hypothetical protein VKQ36_10040 [Ktedonobacterales bacterium]|nr:hypothetical protein [Ktedonobacterales bacterium]
MLGFALPLKATPKQRKEILFLGLGSGKTDASTLAVGIVQDWAGVVQKMTKLFRAPKGQDSCYSIASSWLNQLNQYGQKVFSGGLP